jgi:regulator of RNase E activity RraA
MEDFLRQMMGKRVEVSCGGETVVRGEIVDLKDGIVFLRDDDRASYIAVDKIAIIWEAKEPEIRTGFVTGRLR